MEKNKQIVPACPACKYEVSDDWARVMSVTNAEHTCGMCGATFTIERHVYYHATLCQGSEEGDV